MDKNTNDFLKEVEKIAEMQAKGMNVYYPTPNNDGFRRVIPFDEMIENKEILQPAFDFFVDRYLKKALVRKGMMLVKDFNDLIEETLAKNFHKDDTGKDVIEGFLEYLMCHMKDTGNSKQAFKETRELFGFEK